MGNQICFLKRPVINVPTLPSPPPPCFAKQRFLEGFTSGLLPFTSPTCLPPSLSLSAETHSGVCSLSWSHLYVASPKRAGRGLAFGRGGASGAAESPGRASLGAQQAPRGALRVPPAQGQGRALAGSGGGRVPGRPAWLLLLLFCDGAMISPAV